FVGSIEHTGRIAALLQGIISQTQIPESGYVRLFKIQCWILGKIESRKIGRVPVRVCQRELYRNTHVRESKLRFDRAVFELDQRMDDGLRVNDHLYLRSRNAKQPLRLDYFQSLVHQRR